MPKKSPRISLNQIEGLLLGEGFSHFGFAELKTPLSISIYESWLAKGYQGEMSYLERHLPEKREPQRLLGRARSAIVVTMNYVPHPAPLESWPLSRESHIAAYAKGRDYHHLFKDRLGRVASQLRALSGGEDEFVAFTDSSPVMERDLAQRAGLGWVGKNTCLIDRKHGSLFLLGEIYSTLELPSATVLSPDHCGTCTRCLDVCPTGALTAPRELDARLCISYLTIESRLAPPTELRGQIGDWLFGCDLCQTVCPWNEKAFGKAELKKLDPQGGESGRELIVNDLRFLLRSPNRAIERAFKGTPLVRAGGYGLKRNALVVTGNLGLIELKSEVKELLQSEKLAELAAWTLAQLEHLQSP